MTTGYHQTQKWRLQIFIFYIIGTDMSLNMMNTNQWDFFRIADCLCCRHAYQKSPHQPWSIGDTDSINVIQGHMCFIQCFLND